MVLRVLVLLVLGSTKKKFEAGKSAGGAGTGIMVRDMGEVEAGEGVEGAKMGEEEEGKKKRREILRITISMK